MIRSRATNDAPGVPVYGSHLAREMASGSGGVAPVLLPPEDDGCPDTRRRRGRRDQRPSRRLSTPAPRGRHRRTAGSCRVRCRACAGIHSGPVTQIGDSLSHLNPPAATGKIRRSVL